MSVPACFLLSNLLYRISISSSHYYNLSIFYCLSIVVAIGVFAIVVAIGVFAIGVVTIGVVTIGVVTIGVVHVTIGVVHVTIITINLDFGYY